MEKQQYPKRLIEVDLPIKRISSHARREKSIRHGHISTLHIWWARRPLAACRAVLCASLWPDPADPVCPEAFREAAKSKMLEWAQENLTLASEDSWPRMVAVQKTPNILDDSIALRQSLLDFIADFSDWDCSIKPQYLETARFLTQAAHQTLGGIQGTHPLVVDPFAGGGTIPLEALRVGADTFASDINPVAVILNKVMLEYLPKFGDDLVQKVAKWGRWIENEAKSELASFFPPDEDGSIPVAYLWARTIKCEGPACGATVPLLRSMWLRKKPKNNVALKPIISQFEKTISFEIVRNPSPESIPEGTIRRSSCTCPFCGYTTAAEKVRKQFLSRNGGADDAQLIAVVLESPGNSGKRFRESRENDYFAFENAKKELARRIAYEKENYSIVPDEPLPYLRSIFNIHLLGVDEWGKLFNRRQALSLSTVVKLAKKAIERERQESPEDLSIAIGTCLALAIGRCADYWSSLAVWAGDFVAHTFGRQALGIIWDYAEVNGFSGSTGDFSGAIGWVTRVLSRESGIITTVGQVECATATSHPLPDDSVQAFITDPPYYDAVPYADLSDYFYVWMKRSIGEYHQDLFANALSPKKGEIVQLAERNKEYKYKTKEYFERLMTDALSEGRRILQPDGVGVVVFAHKTTEGWETILNAMIESGWVVTGSWPIDTERPGRLRANKSAALASSVHLVCRPRENTDGTLRCEDIGDWRDVLRELPMRIHLWMPRLAEEGVVGADAIFACLGPALEIFSRYSRVEKADGTPVPLRDYLEQVWSAVAKEALNMVFQGADATGFEEDARLTAMWLWTLAAGESGEDDDDGKVERSTGYTMEYDAARKIAQGLGAHMEGLGHLVEIKGDEARLLPVSERIKHLFSKEEIQTSTEHGRKKAQQFDLFGGLQELESRRGWGVIGISKVGETVLDRIHQSMLLFAANRGEALKRFLVEESVGRDPQFWRLAQALSALYPANTDEKRWVDGVLAKKKSLGI